MIKIQTPHASLFMLLSAFLNFAHGQALNEPANGKLFFGAWLDTADSSPGRNDGDRPALFNNRMKFSSSFFQYAQNIPIDTFPMPIEQIEQLGPGTDVLLTVYPRPSPWNISDGDINLLSRQCGEYNKNGRRVFLRFAPEMNGNWNYWGQQPTQFLILWRRIFDSIRKDAPQTALVWAPSSGNGCNST